MFNTYGKVTLERLEGTQSADGSWISHPLKCLPVGYKPHVFHLQDAVDELDEAFLVVGLCEPGGVVEQSKWSSKIQQTLENFLLLILS